MIAGIVIAMLVQGSTSPVTVTDHQVIATHRVPPVYPYFPASVGATAVCRGAFDTDGEGRPINMCVRCSTRTEVPLGAPARDLVARQFVQATEVALGQWRYSEPYLDRRGVTASLNYHLEDQTADDLPEPPAMGECLGPQIS